MSEYATLEVEVRKNITKAENKKYLNNGYIIGVINQKGLDSIPIAVKRDAFRKVLKDYGRNAIVKLKDSDKNNYDVMVKSIELSPLKYEYYHVDFQKISLDEEIKVDVALKFLGGDLLESKRLILNRQMDTILVSGLPQNIPEAIEVDVSNKESGDNIFVSDLELSKGITAEVDSTLLVASITESKVEVEEEETEDQNEVAATTED
ncbi:MAG: 50S ribosomal protein L25 [Bacillota bacterium]|jgi:large subunit ribosomal protein L25|nr:50S ribosomal protein L25 [Bacillota bacterium]